MKRTITTPILFSFLAIIGVLILFNSKSYSQSQGANSPVWVLNHNLNCNTCPGAGWTAVTNIEASDNAFSTASLLPNGSCNNNSCYFSQDLTPSDYGFSIPSNAVITGIVVAVSRKGSAANAITDSIIQLVINNFPAGDNLAVNEAWTTTNDTYTYGSSTNLWGASWTPSLINDITFGVLVKAKNISAVQQTASVDWIGMTVYYSTATGIGTVSSSSNNNISIKYNSLENNLVLTTNFTESTSNATLTVYDLLGQVQFRKEIGTISRGDVTNNIITNVLRPGIYVAEFEAGNKKFLKKVIVPN
jgi:hypothetical protein